MFSLLQIKPYEYRDPWDIPCSDRVRLLYQKKVRVLYLYEGRDNSTFRNRVFNMVDSLNSAADSEISAAWFYKDEFEQVIQVIPDCTTLVICRTRYSPKLVQLVRLANLHGVRVLFDVDDLIFSLQKLPILIDTIGDYREDDLLNYWYAYVARQAEMLRLCDGAILTNAYLAAQLTEHFPDKPTSVIPNFLNRTQQIYSEEIYHAKRASGFTSINPVSIGYFSGSPSHRRDFNLAAPAIAMAMKRHQNMRLVLVGYIEPGEHLEPIRERIDYYPMQDYVNLQRLIGSVEINVVPLLDNEFTNCKSELKYFEAAIAGTVTIATPTYTYSRAITDGETGYLAKPEEWTSKIEAAFELLNTGRYSSIAERAFEEARCNYAWDQFSERIIEVLVRT
ncbi:Glycosyltransferase-like protein [candidate division TM7 genomosp. GTL1]|nr:Glycosyltransferase-like protein [candidate division TM7 genomosp. GTL1]